MMAVNKKIKKRGEIILQGLPICVGIAIGKAVIFTPVDEEVTEFNIEEKHIDGEIVRYRNALQRSKQEVQKLKARLERERAWEGVAILDGHLVMLQDPTLTIDVEAQIRSLRKNTEAIVQATVAEYQDRFNKITSKFFKERFKDVQDVSKRIIRHLQDNVHNSLADLPVNSIVFSEELSPSDTAEAQNTRSIAFVTEKGGQTSHTAIMAKAQGIPYVANVQFESIKSVLKDAVIIVDAFAGNVIINPQKSTLDFYIEKKREWEKSKSQGKSNMLPAETIDGYQVSLTANVEVCSELELLHEHGGHGVGLFRSESLLMTEGKFPTEEEQFVVYKQMVESMKGLPIVFRTFDIGGDKFGRFYVSKREDNPFLGCRAIRLMLKEKEEFKAQLKAILRASAFGNLSILFPMISCPSELHSAKACLNEAKEELKQQKICFNDSLKVGCMIEVPSAAMTADFLAKECDFLSIGTNDLVQYCIAVDRGNQAMSYLYSPLHPSVLRMIKLVVNQALLHKIPVTVCGEMAADPRFTELLLGLGIHELSVIPRAIPIIKETIRQLSIVQAVKLADKVLLLSSSAEVHSFLEKSKHRGADFKVQKRLGLEGLEVEA
ncbi:MAG: phosphoenolpyruvate--protein phosphotransferase [Chlamydiales bacterium]|nr:phosphoenolpyruvate--protein phosphotransferase [Chlamydiales bacterium]